MSGGRDYPVVGSRRPSGPSRKNNKKATEDTRHTAIFGWALSDECPSVSILGLSHLLPEARIYLSAQPGVHVARHVVPVAVFPPLPIKSSLLRQFEASESLEVIAVLPMRCSSFTALAIFELARMVRGAE